MALKLMYITNRPEVAIIAEKSGVDRIFVDMEYIGKAARQGGMDTVQNHHTIQDVRSIKSVVTKSEVLCRVNPIHSESVEYCSSCDEINGAVSAGADILMLPYFKTTEEVDTFLNLVNGRAKTLLLVETPEAVTHIDEILSLSGIDEVFIGLNDLSLGYGLRFMFEPLANGTVERLCNIFAEKGIPYGFGGIASLGHGLLPSEFIIRDHYRLGSTSAILSRSFCNIQKMGTLDEIEKLFGREVLKIRDLEKTCAEYQKDSQYFKENAREIQRRVRIIVDDLA